MRTRLFNLGVVLLIAAAVSACATSRAFMRGENASRAGDWDAAVEYYRQAIQDDPDRAEYKVAYERATYNAAVQHTELARKAEEEGRLDDAVREYRRASELDPSNRQVAAKVSELERMIRDKIEAARPRPQIDRLREEAQKASPEPILSPTTPLGPVNFNNASVREILQFIGQATGINVLFDRDFVDRQTSINVEGVTLEQALQQLMLTNQLFYKVLNDRTIIVIQDTNQKRTQYEDQVIKTFFLSHADAQEMNQLLTGIIRLPGMPVQPVFVANKTSNTLTARASSAVMNIISSMIEANDKPRAEILIDVHILEIASDRAKQFGLNLSSYQLGLFFSPEVAPTTGETGTTTPFNLNTVSQGVSTADFYLAVPSAVISFLETDSRTKVLAKTQLRGAENQKVSLNLGEEVPVPATTFTPLATGGAAANPLTSYAYRPIGVIVEMTPRVTYDNDVMLTLTLENSARLGDVSVGGTSAPAFSSRRVSTALRLRDGESNLLAGLLREDERRSLRGFPGIIRMPILQQLFGSTDTEIRQTDIVMLLTPRIIRTHQLTAQSVAPIYIGPQSNLSLGGGPPPLLAVPEPPPEVSSPIGGPPAGAPAAPTPQIPAGSSPIPGFTTLPPTPAAPPVQPPAAPAPQLPPPVPAQITPERPPPPPPADPTAKPAAPPAAQEPAAGGARISVTAPPNMTLGAGPYTVPISVSGASRITMLSLSITYNPAVLRVRSVQEGTFMRQGGIAATFTSQPDPGGRVDVVITRPGDQTGAVGTGLLAAILFEPVGAGTSNVSITGVGTVVGTGASAVLQFVPATVTVK